MVNFGHEITGLGASALLLSAPESRPGPGASATSSAHGHSRAGAEHWHPLWSIRPHVLWQDRAM